jgi:hypothetical protein
MRKLIAAGFTAALLAGGTGVAVAGHNGDGHKPQDKGLCTAFFNGHKNGFEKNGYPPPFQDLVNRAEQYAPENNDLDPTNDVQGADAVASFCGNLVGGNPDKSGNGGNP